MWDFAIQKQIKRCGLKDANVRYHIKEEILFLFSANYFVTKPSIIIMKKYHFYFDPKEGEQETPAEETAVSDPPEDDE